MAANEADEFRIAGRRFSARLTTRGPEFFHRHDHIAIVESDMAGSGKFKRSSLGADLPDRKVDRSLSNVEPKRQSDLAKSRIDIFDPILEALSVECAHVAG